MDAELLVWGDGTIRLAFWDSLRGNDRIFILREGLDAMESSAAAEHDEEVLTPVNLIAELRKMAQAALEEPAP